MPYFNSPGNRPAVRTGQVLDPRSTEHVSPSFIWVLLWIRAQEVKGPVWAIPLQSAHWRDVLAIDTTTHTISYAFAIAVRFTCLFSLFLSIRFSLCVIVPEIVFQFLLVLQALLFIFLFIFRVRVAYKLVFLNIVFRHSIFI